MNIFLLEDDISLQNGIHLKLEKLGHRVLCCESVALAEKVINHNFNMAIIDVNLPDGSGLDICSRLRKSQPNLHILLLTANDTEMDMVTGYDMGADDYMTKPFSLAVLMSKINAVQRKFKDIGQGLPFALDGINQSVIINKKPITLTRNEWRLLNKFAENIGQVLTKEQLLGALWDVNGDFVDENTLAVNISRLRGKIELDPTVPVLIENVRGVGYRLKGN